MLGPTELIVLVLGLGLIALIAWIVVRNTKLSGKLKVKDYLEAELNTERPPVSPGAPAGPSSATVAATKIEDSKVVNADQGQRGHSRILLDGEISGSTVVNTTGPVNIGSILGAMGAGAGMGANASEGNNDNDDDTSAVGNDLKQKVVKALATLFDLDEIETLCFDLGIDADEIKGETKSTKARALVRYCENRGQLGSLLALIKSRRANATF